MRFFTEARLRWQYRRKVGHWPNFARPTRFREKIQLVKLDWRSPRMVTLCDKVRAKEVVASVLGNDWVTPTLFAGPILPPRHTRRWDIPYVIKANHASGRNHFVRSRKDEDWDLIEGKVQRWLARSYGRGIGEWAYQQFARQVMVEPCLGGDRPPVDYKFFVFGGRVEFIARHADRYLGHRAAFYDRDWRLLPMRYSDVRDDRLHERPDSLDAMITGAERLAVGFPFVRIDLYEIDKKPRFGEVTFYSGSGTNLFDPDEFDLVLGMLWPPGLPE